MCRLVHGPLAECAHPVTRDGIYNADLHMPSCRTRTRPARGEGDHTPRLITDSDVLAGFLEDAPHYPGGHAAELAQPRSEAEIAAILRDARRVLPIGAQSSLTGGATPKGEVVISTSRLTSIVDIGPTAVRAQAGVPLTVLQETLDRNGLYYPPVPTFTGAFAGGVVATNAAGAVTYKYGSTRDWVHALTVVLATGDVLDIVRGDVQAHPDGYFEIEAARGTVRVPVPTYEMPRVPKRSAGYFAMPRMDLIDLFIGSEGTLGIITEVTFDVLPQVPITCWALVSTSSEEQALTLVAELRHASQRTWRSSDPHGIDVAAIEHMDRRCLELLREDGTDRKHGVVFQADTELVLLLQIELPREALTGADQAYDEIGAALSESAPDTALVRLCRLCHATGVLDQVELALPGDRRRADQFLTIREAVPAAVNQRVGVAKRTIDPAIEKTAADMIVPVAHLRENLQIYRDGFDRRGLDYAMWGHISDGNLHPNVIPRSVEDVRKGKEAILELGREVVRLGGCPLAEHGVGRNPVKQTLLQQLYGEEGIEQMRRVKQALDPNSKLAPGVLFPERGTGR